MAKTCTITALVLRICTAVIPLATLGQNKWKVINDYAVQENVHSGFSRSVTVYISNRELFGPKSAM